LSAPEDADIGQVPWPVGLGVPGRRECLLREVYRPFKIVVRSLPPGTLPTVARRGAVLRSSFQRAAEEKHASGVSGISLNGRGDGLLAGLDRPIEVCDVLTTLETLEKAGGEGVQVFGAITTLGRFGRERLLGASHQEVELDVRHSPRSQEFDANHLGQIGLKDTPLGVVDRRDCDGGFGVDDRSVQIRHRLTLIEAGIKNSRKVRQVHRSPRVPFWDDRDGLVGEFDGPIQIGIGASVLEPISEVVGKGGQKHWSVWIVRGCRGVDLVTDGDGTIEIFGSSSKVESSPEHLTKI